MMTERPIIDAIDQVTPDWLNAVLRDSGALPRGSVASVDPGAGQSTFASTTWRLALTYSADAHPAAPGRLFLKLSSPALAPGDADPDHVRKEIAFYTTVAPAMGAGMTIPCYAAAYDPATGASHLLLRDVSAVYDACLTPIRRNCELAIDALADLHAFWWDHPRLGEDIGSYPTPEERQQGWRDAQTCATAFMAALGDQLPAPWRAVYERVLPALPGLSRRHATGRNLTLVHGDAHLGNFLFPRAPEAGAAYLIDWQFWHPTIGGTDLAFMMATSWEPAIRRALELPLLRRYHDRLLARGVRGYTGDDCWDDYRLSVILVSIFIPVWQWSIFKWAPSLTGLAASMTAFEDLACADLLDGVIASSG